MSQSEKLKHFRELDKNAEEGGGKEKTEEQHSKGKYTARERIDLLLDKGTFQEIDKFVVHRTSDFGLDKKKIPGDGVITGFGKVNGRPVFVYAHDFTVFGGSLSETFGRKVTKVLDLALKAGSPIIGLNDSGGARIQEGVMSLAAYSEIFYRNTLASGVIPQISAILGPCAGGAVYSPAMMDFTVMVDKVSHMFITGPDVVKAALGEEVSFEELGGASIHSTFSGVSHFTARDEEECMGIIRELLSYLPSNNAEEPPYMAPGDTVDREDEAVESIVPDDPNKPYEMKTIITGVLDDNRFFEAHSEWAPNISVGFGRLNGRSVGVVANNPAYLAGALDINSSNKAARFIRFCDAFNIPIITFVDVPGYMPGSDQERGGIIKHGSKLLFAYCEATVPKITTIIRKAYGGAYCAMGSKYSRADINYAWPTAEIAVMGPEGAASIVFRKEVSESHNPASTLKQLVKDYREKFANPYIAAEKGIIDAVIEPRSTRPKLIRALEAIITKREFRPPKKHGNIQL